MAKILLVEDDDRIIDMYGRVLKPGNEVVVAKNLAEAKLQFTAFQPDLVITDHEFPERDGVTKGPNGFELIKHIRSGSWRDTPILWNSGNITITTETAVKEGATIALQKPFRINDLLNAVNQCLQQSQGKG